MGAPADLSVRQHARHACDAPVTIAVGAPSAEAVRLAHAASGAGARVVDCSEGGLGLSSEVYFPQTCHLRLRVTLPGESTPVEIDVRVQRVGMSDRKPRYYIGTSFEGETPAQQKAVSRALAALMTGTPVPQTGKGAA